MEIVLLLEFIDLIGNATSIKVFSAIPIIGTKIKK
jgi:hypothetical protein